MLFLCGGGLAGLSSGQATSLLPADLRKRCVGTSGGALAALATATGDMRRVLRAVDRASWPGLPKKLETELEEWFCTLTCGARPTFASWQKAPGLQEFSVLAWNCERQSPVLFSCSETPEVFVASAVASAADWPGASHEPAFVNGVRHCDLEFVLSPLEVQRHLHPARALLIRGSAPLLQRQLSIVDHHAAFMTELALPFCSGFVARIPGPMLLEGVLRTAAPSRLLPKANVLCWFWLFLTCYLGLTLVPRKIQLSPKHLAQLSLLSRTVQVQKRHRRRAVGQTAVR
jgi:hypothetical protein